MIRLRLKTLILIVNITVTPLFAQEFPLSDFINIYFNKDKYKIERFETDTTIKSKKDFLSRLKKFDSKSYAELEDLMQLNEHNFPQLFYITDINKDGINEYLITENYEGISHLCYTTRNNKLLRFLTGISFSDFLVESPQKIWLIEQDSYLGWERSYELLGMLSKIYCFNLNNFNTKYLFKLYESDQVPFDNSKLPHLNLELPKQHYKPKEIVLNSVSRFYSNYLMPKKYQNTGKISECSHGWVLADTLNLYFAVFDSTTSYLNDSLGLEKITTKDRGYLMCWIPKSVVDFSIKSELSGLYKDNTTNEYLRIIKTDKGIIVNYFSNKSFEKNLILDSFNEDENTIVVKFKSSADKYVLEFVDNFDQIICTNPNKTKQTFIKTK